jgi:Putative zinc-finger
MTEKRQNTVQCSQFEVLLSDALDGILPEEISRAFEDHAAICPSCGPMLAEARQGMLWLQGLEDLEPPKNLVHNILAATTAAEQAKAPEKAAKIGWTTKLWKPTRGVLTGVIQPRFVTSFAMAFFSLSLTLTLSGVKFKDLGKIDWHPRAMGRAVVLQYTQVETKVVQYYKNMRLVYEIESRVSELRKSSDSEQNDQQQQPPAEQPKENKQKKDNNDTSGRPEQQKEHYSRELNDGLIAYLRQNNQGA